MENGLNGVVYLEHLELNATARSAASPATGTLVGTASRWRKSFPFCWRRMRYNSSGSARMS